MAVTTSSGTRAAWSSGAAGTRAASAAPAVGSSAAPSVGVSGATGIRAAGAPAVPVPPAAPVAGTPAVPAPGAPAASTAGAFAAPAVGNPALPLAGTPAALANGAPAVPAAGATVVPEANTPAVPAAGAPAAPAVRAPVQSAAGAPAAPAAGAPAALATSAPVQSNGALGLLAAAAAASGTRDQGALAVSAVAALSSRSPETRAACTLAAPADGATSIGTRTDPSSASGVTRADRNTPRSEAKLPRSFDKENNYAEYVAKYYRVNAETGAPLDTARTTKGSAKFDSSQKLAATASRLGDGKDLLSDALTTICDPLSNKSKTKRAVKVIKKSIIPLLDASQLNIREAASVASPIARSGYAFSRDERRRKRELSERELSGPANAAKKLQLTMVDEYISGTPSPPASGSKQFTFGVKPNRSSRRKGQLPLSLPTPPVPANGVEYGVGEFVKIVSVAKKGSRSRGNLINQIMVKKYVNGKKANLYRVLSLAEGGRVFAADEPWGQVGRKPILSDEEVDKIAKELAKNPTEKFTNELIKSYIQDKVGLCPGMQFSDSTIDNYRALIATRGGIVLSNSSSPKTNNRWTAERSLIGAMSYAVVVAMTHFYPVAEEEVGWRQQISELSKEDRLLYDMVSDFHGGKPIRARPDYLIFNSDDTKHFASEGIQPSKEKEWGLLSSSALGKTGTNSVHHREDSNNMNGLRINRHLITNGRGETAPPVFSIMCTEYEMPDDEFIPLFFDSLCPGGYGVTGSRSGGYILLIRKRKGAEEFRFRWIRDNILFPMISLCRRAYAKIDDRNGARLPEHVRAIHWLDADTSLIRSITKDEGMQAYSNKNVSANKHGAAATARQQSNDLIKTFMVEKKVNKKTTVQYVPTSKHSLKKDLVTTFGELAQKGQFRHKKMPAIIDFFAKQQTVLSKSCVPETIMAGPIKNGMLDEKTRSVPTLHGLLSTCLRVPTNDEYHLCIRSLIPLMEYSYRHGMRYVPDSVFLELGFPKDVDSRGEEKVKTQGISQENQQRAKCLTAEAEVASRAKREEEIEREVKRKEAQSKASAERKRDEDQAFVDRLCSAAGVPSSEDNVAQCQLEHFATLLAPQLQAFILARHHRYTKKCELSQYKKPRTALAEAKAGAKNLVSLAFEVRKNKSKLLAPTTADSETGNQAPSANSTCQPVIRVLAFTADEVGIQPSDILGNPAMLRTMCAIFDPRDRLQRVEISVRPFDLRTARLLEKADFLFATLKVRFRYHIQKRVKLAQHSHWCLPWAAKNLAAVAAYMIYVDHLKIDISCLDESKCLLGKPSNNFLLCSNIEGTHFGCYLFANQNEDVWVRSGSATGERGIPGRLDDHEKRAKMDANHDDTWFYDAFPHSASARSRSKAKEGLFEYLQPHVGASFGDDARTLEILSKDVTEGGLFLYSKEEKERIRRTKFNGKSEDKKFMQMVAYLFELGYDLALSRTHNVSRSPGFEGCGLIFDKKEFDRRLGYLALQDFDN